jgi:hypothetical protein
MNEEKKYFDSDGNPATIEQMVKNEPEWVASRFRFMEDRVKELEDGIRESMRYLEFEVPTGAYKCLEALLPKEKQ